MWAARDECEPKTLRDVIELIARDELDHVAANSQKAMLFSIDFSGWTVLVVPPIKNCLSENHNHYDWNHSAEHHKAKFIAQVAIAVRGKTLSTRYRT